MGILRENRSRLGIELSISLRKTGQSRNDFKGQENYEREVSSFPSAKKGPIFVCFCREFASELPSDAK
jgi:hypothetical protein